MMDLRTLVRIIGPAMAVVALWSVLGWQMPNQAADRAEGRSASARSSLDGSAAQLEILDRQRATAALLQAQVDRFEAAVPAEVDQAGIFRLFDELARSYNVLLGAVQVSTEAGLGSAVDLGAGADLSLPGTSGAADGGAGTGDALPPIDGTGTIDAGPTLHLQAVSVSTTVTGRYEQVLDFVSAIRAAERLYLVDELSLSPDSSDPTVVTASLSLRTFTSPAPAEGATDAFALEGSDR
jgi:hypothetical protein